MFIVYLCHRDKHCTHVVTDPDTPETEDDGSVDGDKKHATRSLTETECTSTDGSVDGDKKRATRFSTIVL